MIETILIIAAIVIGLFIVFVAMRPSTFRYTRTAIIAAPPSQVFALVNSFQTWGLWSPWARLDPLARNTLSGPSAGKDAAFSWHGNNKVGAGHMVITESIPHERILIRLEFTKPFKAVNTTEFTFSAEGDYTKISWSMCGPVNFMGKLIGIFIDCEKMTGDMFIQGLDNMKAFVTPPNA
jgi:uncharacterized protein YndB with AHSA1/START domain